MPTDTHRATWAKYQAAWEEVSETERRDLLTKSVTQDCFYLDPQGQANGLVELIAYIEKFREALPGASFKESHFSSAPCAIHGCLDVERQ